MFGKDIDVADFVSMKDGMNDGMKIGLVTLSNYNYGSVLQCYATQKYLKKYGCDCVLVEKESGKNRWLAQLKTLSSMMLALFQHPKETKAIAEQFLSQRAKSLNLTAESIGQIQQFRQKHIKKEAYSYRELKKTAATEEYDYFFSGSDQVWNGARVSGYDMFFLRFAPKEKRVAWAPSFGGDRIAKYNQKRFANFISQYHMLSAREESGGELIQALTGKKVPILCDPVMLLSADAWRENYRENTSMPSEEPCIVLFFIDEISEAALMFADTMSQEKKMKCISFGYDYPQYARLSAYRHCDGSPYDFLYSLDHASVVITDSFHATAFSAIFHTDFYVFSRSYTHGQNQSARLTHFLGEIGAKDRFDSDRMLPELNFSMVDAFIAKKRNEADDYLKQCLGES